MGAREMAGKSKERTIFYRRADWEKSGNLEKHIQEAHDSLNTTAKRTFTHGETEIQGLSSEVRSSGFYAHVASYIPHESASIVPFPSKETKSKSTGVQPPPKEHNFMHGDVFFAIKKNHILICTSGAREAVAESYIKYILRKSGKAQLISAFSIDAVADVDKIKMIKKEGVKKILMSASLYEASVDYVERTTVKETITNSLAQEIMAIFSKDQNPKLREIQNMENISVNVEITFDSRKKGGEVGKKRIEHLANDIVNEDEDGFKIITGKGNKLGYEEIRISKKVKLPAHGNSVFRASAWDALENYFLELQSAGTLAK